MNIRQLSLTTLSLSLVTTCSATFAAHKHALPAADHQPAQQFVYMGMNSGVSFVHNQSRERYIDNNNSSRLYTNREDTSQHGFNGGLFVGWNMIASPDFLLGVELSGNIYSNRGHYTQFFHQSSNEVSYDLDYSAKLTLRPGWLINDATLLYVQGGVSYAAYNTDSRNLRPSTAAPFPQEFKDKEHMWGPVLGVGIQKQMNACFSLFAAFEYTYYGKVCLKDAAEGGSLEEPRARFSEREHKIDESTFKLGLIYTF